MSNLPQNLDTSPSKNKVAPNATTSSDYVTLLTAAGPANKIIKRKPDSSVSKKPGPPVSEATAQTVRVSSQGDMATLLETIGSQNNRVLCLGFVPGTEPGADVQVGASFRMVSKKIIGEALCVNPETDDGREAVLGWHDVDGEPAICRLKENMLPSSWCLIDIDAADGMPDHLAELDGAGRRDKLADIIPGFADCGLVMLPSTTGRVLIDGEPMDATGEHLFLQPEDPTDLERFGVMLLSRSTLKGYGFQKPNKDKATGEIKSTRTWSIADPTTFTRGRLSYDGSPFVKGKGLSVADPVVEILGSGRLDTSQLLDLTADEATTYAEMTGLRLRRGLQTEKTIGADGKTITRRSYSYSTIDERQLRMDTEIETKAGVITLEEYWKSNDGKLRCQTPFRDSSSENGILNRHADGTPFVYDNGIRTRFVLSAALVEKHRPIINDARLTQFLERLEANELTEKNLIIESFNRLDFNDDIDKATTEQEVAQKMGVGVKAVRSAADAARSRSLPSAPDLGWLERMNERYAVVNDGGAAVVFRVADDATLKRKYIERLKPEAVKILHDNETVLAGVNARGAPVYAGKGAAWLKSENRRQYLEGVVLNVHGNTPEGYYNLWRGWGVEAGEGDWSLMRDHMRDVICGGDEAAFQYLLGWVGSIRSSVYD